MGSTCSHHSTGEHTAISSWEPYEFLELSAVAPPWVADVPSLSDPYEAVFPTLGSFFLTLFLFFRACIVINLLVFLLLLGAGNSIQDLPSVIGILYY